MNTSQQHDHNFLTPDLNFLIISLISQYHKKLDYFYIIVEAAEGKLDLCRRRLHAQSEKVKVYVGVCDPNEVP